MRKLGSFIKKYGPVYGPKLLTALQKLSRAGRTVAQTKEKASSKDPKDSNKDP